MFPFGPLNNLDEPLARGAWCAQGVVNLGCAVIPWVDKDGTFLYV